MSDYDDPRKFWTARALHQGPDYVAPRASVNRSRTQVGAFGEQIRRALGQQRFRWMLDFGCGSGRFAPLISSFGDRYFGADLSSSGIAQAQAAHPDLEFLWLAEDRIPLDDDKVSLAFAITVFQHIVAPEDWELWTGELRRVLKPDAPVFVIDVRYQPDKELADHVITRPPEAFAEALGRTVHKLPEAAGHWVGMLRP